MSITLRTLHETLRFHSPLEGMALVEQQVERRQDPLLGHWAACSSGLKGKGQFFFHAPDHERMETIAAETREGCFFCPDKVEAATPRYPEDLLPGGALKRGECFLFPNLFPIAPVHAVVAMGHEHYRRLDAFPVSLLADGLGVAVEFVRRYHQADPEARFFTISGNYLFPAGASLVHPHIQILGGRNPLTAVERLLVASSRWEWEHGGGYFEQLLEHEETEGERWIGRTGSACWLAPFAPTGANEVMAVLPGKRALAELEDEDVRGLSMGLSRVLAHYGRLGFSTFNFSIFAGPCDDANGPFPVHLRVICRQNVSENYRSDGYFLQRLLGEELMITLPEDLAAGMRVNW